MKEKELRKVANCAMCKKPIGHTGLPLFWRIRIQRYGLKIGALKRQQGLTMMLGGHAELAAVMGPDEDMAEKISGVEITLCEKCAIEESWPIVVLAEEKEDDKP